MFLAHNGKRTRLKSFRDLLLAVATAPLVPTLDEDYPHSMPVVVIKKSARSKHQLGGIDFFTGGQFLASESRRPHWFWPLSTREGFRWSPTATAPHYTSFLDAVVASIRMNRGALTDRDHKGAMWNVGIVSRGRGARDSEPFTVSGGVSNFFNNTMDVTSGAIGAFFRDGIAKIRIGEPSRGGDRM